MFTLLALTTPALIGVTVFDMELKGLTLSVCLREFDCEKKLPNNLFNGNFPFVNFPPQTNNLQR